MHHAARELRGDLAGRQIGDLDIVEAGNRAAIIACAARLGERKPGAREKRFGVFLQAALGGNGENEGRTHATLPCAAGWASRVRASLPTENPNASNGLTEPHC